MNDESVASRIVRLLNLIRTLRGENGCPWDRAQTPGTIIPYLLEEAFEVVDAFEQGDAEGLCSELGDLFFQLVFLVELEEEIGRFRFEEVLDALIHKMIRRHPHVFGTDQVSSVAEVAEAWRRIKREESRTKSRHPLESVPRCLPALMLAQRVSERASEWGFDWKEVGEVVQKVEEEWREFKESLQQRGPAHPAVREEMGDLLFAVVNVCRFLRIPSEFVLRDAVHKFIRRFEAMTEELRSKGKDPETSSQEEMDAVWNRQKFRHRQNAPGIDERIAKTEERIGYRFGQLGLLRQALCHDSYAHEHPGEFRESNERLEFLGDAVLSFLVSTRLYHTFPDAEEGELSRLRSALVNAHSLARAARDLGLNRSVLLGRGEEGSGGREKASILSDVMEAVLAAVYLDGGLEAADDLVERMLGDRLRSREFEAKAPDYKSRLQEQAYALFKMHPQYVLVEETGPDHDKTFRMAALLDGRRIGTGTGKTKKEAAQAAARAALDRIESGWRP